jgi:flavin-binding protein dodecin
MPEMPPGKNVAAVTHIIAESPAGFGDAVRVGFARATKTLRGITGMRVMEQRVSVRDNKIATYRVKLEVILLLEPKVEVSFKTGDELKED